MEVKPLDNRLRCPNRRRRFYFDDQDPRQLGVVNEAAPYGDQSPGCLLRTRVRQTSRPICLTLADVTAVRELLPPVSDPVP